MATLQFQQGGRQISVMEDPTEVTIHAADEDDARDAAARAGLELRGPSKAGPGLVRASIAGDRDAGMARLRQQKVVHHVYRDATDPQQEFLITDSFHVKFKPGPGPYVFSREHSRARRVSRQRSNWKVEASPGGQPCARSG